jgi:hypothetical protein
MLVVLASGAGLVQFEVETNDAKLWAPLDSPAVESKRRMDELFGFVMHY